jgi:hypothetical protein
MTMIADDAVAAAETRDAEDVIEALEADPVRPYIPMS